MGLGKKRPKGTRTLLPPQLWPSAGHSTSRRCRGSASSMTSLPSLRVVTSRDASGRSSDGRSPAVSCQTSSTVPRRTVPRPAASPGSFAGCRRPEPCRTRHSLSTDSATSRRVFESIYMIAQLLCRVKCFGGPESGKNSNRSEFQTAPHVWLAGRCRPTQPRSIRFSRKRTNMARPRVMTR